MAKKPTVSPQIFQYKQVIVTRIDLKMSKGKMAVQVAHAAISAAEKSRKQNSVWWRAWIAEGQRKIVVRTESKQKLLELEKKAKDSNLPTALIVDKGLTELPPDTITCLGIGPAPSPKIEAITGKLSLL
jgi:PTH2 family peptidyl-tRNA hydrolase